MSLHKLRMHITPTIETILTSASTKALATDGPAGLNVVPVSTIAVFSEEIWLCDYFMGKTRTNLTAAPHVPIALTAWEGLDGIQLKGNASYLTTGESFTDATVWVAKLHPDRTLHGLIVIQPTAVFDVSPLDTYAAAIAEE